MKPDPTAPPALLDWLRANGIDPASVPVDAAISCDGHTIRCEVLRPLRRGEPDPLGSGLVRDVVSARMTSPPEPHMGPLTLDPQVEGATRRWRHDGTRRVPGVGDGDPREYGGRLPDGRLWVHPPYGPVQVRRGPLFPPPPPSRSWRARLARWWARRAA